MWVHKFGVYPGCNHIVNLPLIFLVSVVLAACTILATLVTLLADMVEETGPEKGKCNVAFFKVSHPRMHWLYFPT